MYSSKCEYSFFKRVKNKAKKWNLMKTILIPISYLVYVIFWGRFFLHALLWCRASKESGLLSVDAPHLSFKVCALMAMDLIFFRRLFNTDKVAWLGSWTFHVTFFLVVLRHLKYFMNPVPGWIACIQPLGLVAGYVLPVSAAYIFILRITGRDKYVSYYNFFLLGILLLISITGLLMRNFFMVDVVAAKEFILGILTFRPVAMPGGFQFFIHFFLVLLLVLYLPLHIFTAPIVTMEARRREEGLNMVMHEK